MGTGQIVALAVITWLVGAVPLALIAGRVFRRLDAVESASDLPELHQQYIDTLIDDVLQSQEGADAWLDRKKLIIAKVFSDGEAWCNANGDLVEKDDPTAVAHITFNVIRAAMMKFYAGGILNMTKEDGE